MPDDADKESPALDAQREYWRYRATCRKLGVKPVPRERARKLIKEWADMLAAIRSVPPTQH